MFTTGMAFKIGYIVVLLIIIVGLMYYLRVKCRKTEKSIPVGFAGSNAIHGMRR